MYPASSAQNSKFRAAALALVIVVSCITTAVGQLGIGDNTQLNLSGWLGFGYNGNFGDTTGSSHGTSLTGDFNLNGFYYHPSFLSFNAHPYYNRNQTNSLSQTTNNSTGFESQVNLFSGSKFPGSIGYSRQFVNADEVGNPGATLLTTDGASQNFTITWNELVPNLPTLTVNYSKYSNSSHVVGTDTDSRFSGQNFNVGSTYTLAGFQLMGFFNRQGLSLALPNFVNPNTTSNENSSTSYGVSAMHKLPLSGSFTASWNRTSYQANNNLTGDNSYNNVNLGAAILPTRKLTLSTNVNYVDSLSGVLQQTVNGGVFSPVRIDLSSRSVSINNQAYYTLGYGFGLSGYANYRNFWFQGRNISNTQYGGLVTYRYARPLFGMLYFNFGLVNTVNETGNSGLGFTGNLGLTKRVGRWETNLDVSYQQSVQTQVALFTTSNVSYGGNLRRKVNMDTYWNVSFRALHNALTHYEGDSNRSESFGSGISWRRYMLSAYYSQAKGSSVLSANGTFVPTPIGPLVSQDILYYNGKSYSVSLAATPIKRLTITGYYTNVESETQSSVFSFNRGNRYNALVEYQWRKMAFRGGYTRTQQEVSATSTLPAVVNSYFFSISRWFNIF
jgi:hypothetical protein